MNTLKYNLEYKLQEALLELNKRLSEAKPFEVQRMYGYCLGARMALQELQRHSRANAALFRNDSTMDTLARFQLGKLKTRTDIENFKSKMPFIDTVQYQASGV